MRVLVTRAYENAYALTQPLAEAGHEVVQVPLVARQTIHGALQPYWMMEEQFDLALVTSAAAAEPFSGALEMGLPDIPRVYAVGPATKRALNARNIATELLPAGWTSEDAVNLMGVIFGKRVLWPCAEEPNPRTAEMVESRGARLTAVPVYRNVEPPAYRQRLAAALPVDVITLLSGSAARRLVESGADLGDAKVVVIGPTTAGVCQEIGLSVHAVADPHSVQGVVDAVAGLAP